MANAGTKSLSKSHIIVSGKNLEFPLLSLSDNNDSRLIGENSRINFNFARV